MTLNPCRYCGKPLRMTYSTAWNHDTKVRPVLPRCNDCGCEDFEPPNDAGYFTCCKCGEEMAAKTVKRVVSRKPVFERPGYLGNGYFCTLTCGYRYGLRAVTKENGP